MIKVESHNGKANTSIGGNAVTIMAETCSVIRALGTLMAGAESVAGINTRYAHDVVPGLSACRTQQGNVRHDVLPGFVHVSPHRKSPAKL